MERMEKVEKLRERANVSYEEAKAALEANEWDLLDAMVALEKAGKTGAPKQQNYSTSYDQHEEYIPVKKTVEEQQKKDQPRPGRTIRQMFRRFFDICRDNAFCITHKGNEIVRMPLLAAVVILLFTWKIAIPVMLVALLFGIRYNFEGKDDLKEANAFMETAGNAAESLKEGFMNSANADSRHAEATASDNADSSETADAMNSNDTVNAADSSSESAE